MARGRGKYSSRIINVVPNMDMHIFYKMLPLIEEAFHRLEKKIEPPALVSVGRFNFFRYKNKSIEAAIVQKLARIVSGLHACLVLLENGFVQELGAIFRTLDEFNEDVNFLCQPLISGEPSDLHRKYLAFFYQEEYDDPEHPFLSSQKRQTIPRQKIHSAISKMPETPINPSDCIEMHRTISKAYSGFVHGASPQIMDMYGGNPPRFHVSGMVGTPRIDAFTENCGDYFYRGLISIMTVSLCFGEHELSQKLMSFKNYFEKETGKGLSGTPEGNLKKIKGKKA